MYHGYPTCYDTQTFNTMLNKTMGDLYREPERYIERVKTYGYMYYIMWECQWEKICKTDVEVRGHVDSYSLAGVMNPRDALYGGRGETFALHDQSTDRSVIKHVDVQSLYPYVCKSKVFDWTQPPWSRRELLRRTDQVYGSTTEGSIDSSLVLSH